MSLPVSIIIPAFNQLSYTRACVETLLADPEVCENAQIVVVDSGSSDGTPDYLRNNATKITSRRMSENVGYSRACNAGVEIAQGAELVFLNNDTIPEKGWLGVLRKTLGLLRVGLVGPKLLYPQSRTINSAGYVYGKAAGAFYHIYHRYPEDFSGVNRRREFQALLGACVMLRRTLFDEIGGISDFGYDDIDLCFKIRARGQKIIYEPSATVLHHGSVTLQNSLPGSIPITDNTSFGERWPRASFAEDDAIFYSEDGFEFVSLIDGVVTLKETISQSCEYFEKAMDSKAQGQLEKAKAELEQAISRYLGHTLAYEELIMLQLETGDVSSAIGTAEKMAQHVVDSHQAQLTLASLLESVGRESASEEVLKQLLQDWALPDELREAAMKIWGRLRKA